MGQDNRHEFQGSEMKTVKKEKAKTQKTPSKQTLGSKLAKEVGNLRNENVGHRKATLSQADRIFCSPLNLVCCWCCQDGAIVIDGTLHI